MATLRDKPPIMIVSQQSQQNVPSTPTPKTLSKPPHETSALSSRSYHAMAPDVNRRHLFRLISTRNASRYEHRDAGDAARKEANKKVPGTDRRLYDVKDFVYIWDKPRSYGERSQIRVYQVKSRDMSTIFRVINQKKHEHKMVVTKLLYCGYYPVDSSRSNHRELDNVYTEPFVGYRRKQTSNNSSTSTSTSISKPQQVLGSPATFTNRSINNYNIPSSSTNRPTYRGGEYQGTTTTNAHTRALNNGRGQVYGHARQANNHGPTNSAGAQAGTNRMISGGGGRGSGGGGKYSFQPARGRFVPSHPSRRTQGP